MQKKRSVRRPSVILETIESRIMLSSVTGSIATAKTLAHVPTPAVTAPVKAAKVKTISGLVGAPSPAWTSTSDGLTGAYFRGPNFQTPVLTRTDADIDFLWGPGAPDPSLVGHAFSVQWTGQITPAYSERYVFQTISDDGVRVWIGGQLVINDWHEQWPTLAGGAISLQAGQTYDIRVDYFANQYAPSDIRLSWKSPSQPLQIVPTAALTTVAPQASSGITATSTPPNAPANLTASAASQTQINLSWSNVAGESGFVVERSADGVTGWTSVGTTAQGVTQYSDTGLAAGTSYFYRVEATSDVGNSTPSSVATAITTATPPPAPDLVYALTSDGYIDQIDATTGSATQIGTLLFGTSAGDRDPISGKFYYLDQNTPTPRVAVWDPATNTNTVIGTVSLSGPVLRAAFRADGTFFITAGDGNLYTINTTTAAATFVGTITSNGAPLTTSTGDMAFTSSGQLYLDTEGSLYSIDLTTFDATYLGNDASVGKVQIAFGSEGILYGTANSGDFYSINIATGATTFIGASGVLQIGDLAGVPM